MSKGEFYRRRIEFALIRAELSQSEPAKRTWLLILECYRHLLSIETKIVADQTMGLVSFEPHAEFPEPDEIQIAMRVRTRRLSENAALL